MWRTAALLLAVAAPLAASGFDWNARVGADYTRDDFWSRSGDRLTYTSLDLNLGLDASGYIQDPNLLAYALGAEYRRLSAGAPSDQSVQRRILYRGELKLLPGPANPFHLDLRALRSDESYDVRNVSSSGLTTIWGATATYSQTSRPTLQLGYQSTEVERVLPSGEETDRRVQTVTGLVREGTSAFGYNGRYRGNFSEGTYDFDDYADHRVDLSVTSRVGADWRASLSDLYYRRNPTTTAASNMWQEYNSFGAAVTNTLSAGEYQRFNLRYNHAIQESPLSPTIERADQRLEYYLQKELADPSWRLFATADVSQIQDRRAQDEAIATGETVGAIVSWRRPSAPGLLELRGGPSFGYVQPLREDPFFGYGVAGGATYERSLLPAILRLGYTVDFRNDLRSEGRSLTQSANGSVSGPLRSGVVTGSVQASASRFDSPLLATRLARAILLEGDYRYSTYEVRLQLGTMDSVNPSLDESVMGDGLIVAPYDSHTRYVSLSGGAAFARTTRANGALRFSAIEQPDRPTTTELEARAGIEFNYGALRVSLEDRYTITSVSGTELRANEIRIRLFRTFGSNY